MTIEPPVLPPRRGFTLIELMVAVAVVGILAAIAFPSYARYVARSRTVAALTTLSTLSIALEQRYQDVGRYANDAGTACGIAMPASTGDFSFACQLGTPGNPAGFRVTATGRGAMAAFAYDLDDAGLRRTLGNPYGLPPTDCWTIRGGTCDS